MLDKRPIGTLSELSAPLLGAFHGRAAELAATRAA
jgi:hypothetical protein